MKKKIFPKTSIKALESDVNAWIERAEIDHIGKIKCKNCGYEHTIKSGLTTTDGGICDLVAFSELEVELWCRCGEKLLYDSKDDRGV